MRKQNIFVIIGTLCILASIGVETYANSIRKDSGSQNQAAVSSRQPSPTPASKTPEITTESTPVTFNPDPKPINTQTMNPAEPTPTATQTEAPVQPSPTIKPTEASATSKPAVTQSSKPTEASATSKPAVIQSSKPTQAPSETTESSILSQINNDLELIDINGDLRALAEASIVLDKKWSKILFDPKLDIDIAIRSSITTMGIKGNTVLNGLELKGKATDHHVESLKTEIMQLKRTLK
ncbi:MULTISPECIES: hypothetical protein [unclassified Paenibacillus]|uniref:hypothetical protein n=1 Tax=unclassified Paenibacillus TaxID=185978 RepID=UPI002782B716|nr:MULTISPECIES: hypothetical protein [unclassified Paenibacillus]MDQ0896337.1 hypothetical protein [Paenibacillus sp. V4I7]MDQ0914120.1 hypothetical protein [Paenibacillus sp. V4I5]